MACVEWTQWFLLPWCLKHKHLHPIMLPISYLLLLYASYPISYLLLLSVGSFYRFCIFRLTSLQLSYVLSCEDIRVCTICNKKVICKSLMHFGCWWSWRELCLEGGIKKFRCRDLNSGLSGENRCWITHSFIVFKNTPLYYINLLMSLSLWKKENIIWYLWTMSFIN